jgi:threonine/homoserine/homoserine lactone efflux protein
MVLSLILAAVVVMGSPGPSTISMTAVGAAYGLRRSLGYLLGLVAGTTVVLIAVAAGVVSLLLSVPRLAPVLLGASAVYMLYLAFRIATAPPLSKQAGAGTPSFAGAFLLAVANPKAYLAIAAVFAGSTLDALPKVAILIVMIVAIHVCWLLAGASLSRLFYDPVRSRIANAAFAATLVLTTAFTFA